MATSTASVNCTSRIFKMPSDVEVSRWFASEFSSRAACAMVKVFMSSPFVKLNGVGAINVAKRAARPVTFPHLQEH